MFLNVILCVYSVVCQVEYMHINIIFLCTPQDF